ncbi:hypothetical protein AAFC00_004431 [Neodothiora populina]|uniref:ABC transmembrane type-1 domain-containing protein n=1 Tax=Neodothiora populina TaxID=2781224 RepID=A0ABR3P1Y4_9PEZI
MRRPLVAASIPRLFLIIFRYSQPALVKEVIKYVEGHRVGTGGNDEQSKGLWLVVSAILIYVGIAVSTAIYQHHINRLRLMTRSSLMRLIHDNTMQSVGAAYDNSEAPTLISNDAVNLDGAAEMIHETWAQVFEVLIGISFLANQVDYLWLPPFILIYPCSYMSRFVAKHLQPHQKAWSIAT